MGWLTKEVGDFVYIEQDRTVENLQFSSGTGNGIILPKNYILEIHLIAKRESE